MHSSRPENKAGVFPEGFFWGASTSAHQVEGGNTNNWTEWEEKNAKRLAGNAKNEYAFLREDLFREANNPENYRSGKAADHYHRFREDFDIMSSLGLNAYRFSIEWSRIEPKQGVFDEKEINHYIFMIKELRARGIEPFVTLWHWTVPVWFEDKGGWESKDAVSDFEHFVTKAASVFPEVKFWITLNEPDIYSYNSYKKGEWPPQKKSIFKYFRVRSQLIRAHKTAYNALKRINPGVNVGIAKDTMCFQPYKGKWINRLISAILSFWVNKSFLNAIRSSLDFIGVNYYFRNLVHLWKIQNENKIVSDMGWELYPSGISEVLTALGKYKLPMYVTETGLADSNDEKREWYLREILKEISQEIGKGIDVRGFFYWSLLDNFEWDKGFWPRFGLIEVEYTKSCARRVRPSAIALKKIIREGL